MFKSEVINKIFVKGKIKAVKSYLLLAICFKSKQMRFYIPINGEGCPANFALFAFYILIELIIDIQGGLLKLFLLLFIVDYLFVDIIRNQGGRK